MAVVHLPYEIDPQASKCHYYEELWKDVAFGMLQRDSPQLSGWTHLDFGCGRGESMRRARDLGMITHGTDTDPECVRRSSAFGTAMLLDEEGLLAEFGEKSFDVVTCFHVLEHVPRPKETLTTLARLARRRVLVAVPNLSAFHDLIRTHSRWDGPINEGHLQSWDHSHFRNLAERHCGLRILGWGFDTVLIPPLSTLLDRVFGKSVAIWLETRVFKRLFPFASLSIIALMEPCEPTAAP